MTGETKEYDSDKLGPLEIAAILDRLMSGDPDSDGGTYPQEYAQVLCDTIRPTGWRFYHKYPNVFSAKSRRDKLTGFVEGFGNVTISDPTKKVQEASLDHVMRFGMWQVQRVGNAFSIVHAWSYTKEIGRRSAGLFCKLNSQGEVVASWMLHTRLVNDKDGHPFMTRGVFLSWRNTYLWKYQEGMSERAVDVLAYRIALTYGRNTPQELITTLLATRITTWLLASVLDEAQLFVAFGGVVETVCTFAILATITMYAPRANAYHPWRAFSYWRTVLLIVFLCYVFYRAFSWCYILAVRFLTGI